MTAPPDPDPPDKVALGSVLRLLREPAWARITLGVIALSVTFVLLGRWQMGKHLKVVASNTVIDANFSAAPVPLDQVLPTTTSPLARDRVWTSVRVTGQYEPQHQVVIRNRPLNGDYGYEVVVPLRLASGAALLIDRGWLESGQDFVRPDTVPAPPGGQVTVVARLVPGEGNATGQAPPGEEERIDINRIAAQAGGPVYRGGYAQLAQEQPAPAVAPTMLPKPDEDLGPYLSYAIQWWAGAIAAYVMLGVYLVRDARERQLGPVGTVDASERRLVSARARRRGPTDEEWEDAADR